jgi:hypothetical protein
MVIFTKKKQQQFSMCLDGNKLKKIYFSISWMRILTKCHIFNFGKKTK